MASAPERSVQKRMLEAIRSDHRFDDFKEETQAACAKQSAGPYLKLLFCKCLPFPIVHWNKLYPFSRGYWHASHSPPLSMASSEQAARSWAV